MSSDDYIAVLDTSERKLMKTEISHACADPIFGAGDISNYGHVKLRDFGTYPDTIQSNINAGNTGLSLSAGCGLATSLTSSDKYEVEGQASHLNYSKDAYFFIKTSINPYLDDTYTLAKAKVAIPQGAQLINGTNFELKPLTNEVTNANINIQTNTSNIASLTTRVTNLENSGITNWVPYRNFNPNQYIDASMLHVATSGKLCLVTGRLVTTNTISGSGYNWISIISNLPVPYIDTQTYGDEYDCVMYTLSSSWPLTSWELGDIRCRLSVSTRGELGYANNSDSIYETVLGPDHTSHIDQSIDKLNSNLTFYLPPLIYPIQ